MSENQQPPQGVSDATSDGTAIASGPGGTSQTESVIITSYFKMVWLTMTALTLSLAATDVLLAILLKNPSGSAQQAMTMCDTFAGMGFGAIFGLISGKALG
jgi:hypothetical protein